MENLEWATPAEDTTPTTDNPTNAESTETTETEASNTEGTTDNATATETGTEGNDGATANTETEEALPGLTVKFRHESKELSHDEAVSFAQKGMKYDSIEPMLKNLNMLAAMSGKKAEDLVSDYISAAESNYRESLIDRYGEDNEVVDILMDKYRADNQKKFDLALESKKTAEEAEEARVKATLEDRLATEFGELKKEFPDVTDFANLPKAVKEDAARGKDLVSAYLLYQHREATKVAKANEAAKAARESSAGSLASAEINDGVVDAFLEGMRG